MWNVSYKGIKINACLNIPGGMLGTYIAAVHVEDEWGWSFLIPGFIVGLMSLVVFFLLVVHPSDLQKLGERNKGILEKEGLKSEHFIT